MLEEQLHYTDVCRGRYICKKHGGFCDGADNYVPYCPVCGEDPKGRGNCLWEKNKIDRILHLVNGMQKRAMRNASLITVAIGSFGALNLVTKLAGASEKQSNPLVDFSPFFFQLSLATLVLCVVAYSFAMRHIKITYNQRIPSKTYSCWIKEFQVELANLEKCNSFASLMFVLSLLFVFAAFLPPEVREFISNLLKD